MYWATFWIWLIILTALAVIYQFIASPAAVQSFLGNDETIFKLTYQFFLITVVGAGVAHLYKQLERIREMRKSLRDMHTELLDAFNQAKTVRRKCRAKLGTRGQVDANQEIDAEFYEEQMELLSDAQLTFEVYAKRASDRWLWFWGNTKLGEALSQLEKYLNKIVKEYQDELSKFAGDPPVHRIGELKRFTEFIGPYDDASDFQTKFKHPIRDALQALSREILR